MRPLCSEISTLNFPSYLIAIGGEWEYIKISFLIKLSMYYIYIIAFWIYIYIFRKHIYILMGKLLSHYLGIILMPKLSQIWPVEASLRWLLHLSDMFPQFFRVFLYFLAQAIQGSHCVISWPWFQNCPFLPEALAPCRLKIYVQIVLAVSVVSLILGSSCWSEVSK